jgi:HSP20 family molecular chaperone IbpA
MAFFVPRVVVAPNRCYAPSAPRHSVAPFLSLLDDTFNELARASRQARRSNFVNNRFDVRETEQAYEVDGELPGIEQEDIEIEFSDESTLVIKAKSERKVESGSKPSESQETAPAVDDEKKSETASEHSHQATVEDDFEDLANETETVSAGSESSEKPSEVAKGKAPEQPQEVQQQEQAQPQQRRWVSERSYGSFTRTFRFPGYINREAVTANLKNGILSIVVPKAPVPEVRRIQIA